MKRPAFQFYPADWRKDPGVQSLSYHDRGVWFEIICLLHESEERGKLLLNGKPMPEDALARLLGLDKQRLNQTVSTLLEFGVASRCDETGALMSRRMVRDEALSKIRAESGKMGGNPVLLNQNTKQKTTTRLNQKATPSSSSSSSDNIPLPPLGFAGENPVVEAPCTIEQAIEKGKELRISEQACAFWWHTRNAAGWMKSSASGHPRRITGWQSDLSTSRGWAEEQSDRSKAPGNGKSRELRSTDISL